MVIYFGVCEQSSYTTTYLVESDDSRSRRKTTGISSEIGTKLRDWAVWQARTGYYSQAAVSSIDSKTLYRGNVIYTLR